MGDAGGVRIGSGGLGSRVWGVGVGGRQTVYSIEYLNALIISTSPHPLVQ